MPEVVGSQKWMLEVTHCTLFCDNVFQHIFFHALKQHFKQQNINVNFLCYINLEWQNKLVILSIKTETSVTNKNKGKKFFG